MCQHTDHDGAIPCAETKRIVETSAAFATMVAANADMMQTTAESLNCVEANALIDLLIACGFKDEAHVFAVAHCLGDDEGDDPTHLAAKEAAEALATA